MSGATMVESVIPIDKRTVICELVSSARHDLDRDTENFYAFPNSLDNLLADLASFCAALETQGYVIVPAATVLGEEARAAIGDMLRFLSKIPTPDALDSAIAILEGLIRE